VTSRFEFGWMALILICLGFGIRLYGAAVMPLTPDEQQYIPHAKAISFSPQRLHLNAYAQVHSPGALYLIKGGTLLLGWTLLGVRLVNVLLGTTTLVILYLFARSELGSREALLSLLLISLNPFHIGLSRIALLEQYLCFALLAVILFWKAVTRQRGIFMVAAGLALGIGSWIKESTLFLIPVFAGYLWWTGRIQEWKGRRSTTLALGLVLLFLLPYLYHDLTQTSPCATGYEGYVHAGYWLRWLRLFTYNVKPLTLYLPSLFFKIQNLEGLKTYEYPFMDHLSGLIILAGVGEGWRIHRQAPLVGYLLVIFMAVFSFFSFFIDPHIGEFWWAALTFLPGVLLGGLWLGRVSRDQPWRWLLPCGLGAWLFWCSLFSVTQPTLDFDGSFMAPVGEVAGNFKRSLKSLPESWMKPL